MIFRTMIESAMVHRPSHVMAIDMKAVAKIRPVGKMTLIAGIQVHGGATSLLRLFLQILQYQCAQALPMKRAQGYQIINVKNVSPGHRVEKSIPSRGHNLFSFFDVYDLIAFPDLFAPALDELSFGSEMGAEFAKCRQTPSDIGFGFCGLNLTDFRNDTHGAISLLMFS